MNNARAADRGDAEAMNMAGRCYENGWGVATDLAKAAERYRSSAEAGHDWGEYNFGNMVFDGRGVPQDRRQAWQFHLLPLNRDERGLQMATCSEDLVRSVNFSARKLDEPVPFLIAERQQLREFLMRHYPVPDYIAQYAMGL